MTDDRRSIDDDLPIEAISEEASREKSVRNPSIGIILCRSKDRALVEYALRDSRKPIGVATYRVVKRLPQALAKELPDAKQLEELILEEPNRE